MREIKFRVWDTSYKKYLSLKDYQDLGAIEVENDGTLTLSPRYRFLTSMMIMPERFVPQQYTGLKDKNGVEIYEGDIVVNQVFKAKVEWNNSFCGFYPFCNEMSGIFTDECEVIGNIYDKVGEE